MTLDGAESPGGVVGALLVGVVLLALASAGVSDPWITGAVLITASLFAVRWGR